MGAVMVVGGAAAASPQAEPKPARSEQDKKPPNVVDLAVERMAKGHS